MAPYAVVTSTIRLRFNFDSTAIRPPFIVHKFIVHRVLTLTAKKRDQRDYKNSDKNRLFDSHSTAVRQRYDHSTLPPTCCSALLHCGLSKQVGQRESTAGGL